MASAGFSNIGGHPAIDFINTRPLRKDGPHELLADWASVVAWARQFDIIDGTALVSEGDAGAVRTLRDAFARILQGNSPAAKDVQIINDALARSAIERQLIASGGRFELRTTRRIGSADQLVAGLAHIIAEFLASPAASRVRQCAGDKCVLWFIDSTRNHSRQWCRMDRCGARAKAAAYYARNKAKGPERRRPGPSNPSD